MSTDANPLPHDAYATFSTHQIDDDDVHRILSGLAGAINDGSRRVHLLFQSAGGEFGSGLSLYNFFRRVPIELIIYNAGRVESIAVVAYLGAQKRIASARAFFMIHRTRCGEIRAPASHLHAQAERMRLCDAACASIIHEHTRIPADKWAIVNNDNDLILSAAEALDYGLVEEIGEFAPPAGTQIRAF